MPEYKYSGPVDSSAPINNANLEGKTAIVTGGASGIGEGYVRALVAVGVNICIGDLNEERGLSLENELQRVKFVKVNVSIWEDQLRLFKEAEKFSPTGKISYVVANAGMIKPDSVYHVSGNGEPQKPDLQILDVNITGSMYTIALALHYFVKQNGTVESPDQEDTCLLLIGSGASFLDGPRAPQYAASKWAMRGVLHSLRRTAFYHGSRVNMIAPWYVQTSILSEEAFNNVAKAGVAFAQLEDAQNCLLRILGDTSINGRSLFIGPRKWKAEGYWDLDIDDYHRNPTIEQIQQEQMWSEPISKGLFPS